MAAAHIERGGASQLLGDAGLYPAALAVGEVVVVGEFGLHLDNAVLGLDVVAAHTAIGGIGKAVVAPRGVAVAHQLNIGADFVKRFVIEKTQRLPLMVAVVRQGGVCLGHVQRYGAELAHVFADAEVKGAVAVGQLGAAVQRPARRQAVKQRSLEEFWLLLLVVAAAVFSRRQGEARMALALQHRHR